MKRILVLIAATLLLTCSQANAQYVRGQVGGNFNIYPDGTIAYSYGPNNYRSGYFYLPPVVDWSSGSSSYYYGMQNYGNRGNQGYYVPPNGSGGGYYSNTPGYYNNGSNYYGR